VTVKVLTDTSVLVAAMVDSHPSHERALPWLQRAKRGEVELAVCTHTLAELFAVLTTLPVRPKIGPDLARRLIRENVESAGVVVDLGGDDYRAVLDSQTALGLRGGSVYDAVAARAARIWGADQLLTLNERDFRRAWPEAANRIAAP